MKSSRSEWYLGRHWLLFLGLQMIPIVIVIVASLVLAALAKAKQDAPFLVWIALILAIVGLTLLFLAKLPLYRQGEFFTFGIQGDAGEKPQSIPDCLRCHRIEHNPADDALRCAQMSQNENERVPIAPMRHAEPTRKRSPERQRIAL